MICAAPYRAQSFFYLLTQPFVRYAHCRLGFKILGPSDLRKLARMKKPKFQSIQMQMTAPAVLWNLQAI
jgi:hypothetical protein